MKKILKHQYTTIKKASSFNFDKNISKKTIFARDEWLRYK